MKTKITTIFLQSKTGRMSKEIIALAAKEENIFLAETASKASVVVDFSFPAGAIKAAELAKKNKIALVCGTTGLTQTEMNHLKKCAKDIAVLYSPNMSVGISALTKALKELSPIKHYDFYIEEIHHAEKKDAPSGTALRLQSKLEETIGKKIKQNISLRGGGVFGQHRIIALGPEETIILHHEALNRTVFARGALFCARWIVNQKPGFYSIEDALRGTTT